MTIEWKVSKQSPGNCFLYVELSLRFQVKKAVFCENNPATDEGVSLSATPGSNGGGTAENANSGEDSNNAEAAAAAEAVTAAATDEANAELDDTDDGGTTAGQAKVE